MGVRTEIKKQLNYFMESRCQFNHLATIDAKWQNCRYFVRFANKIYNS